MFNTYTKLSFIGSQIKFKKKKKPIINIGMLFITSFKTKYIYTYDTYKYVFHQSIVLY